VFCMGACVRFFGLPGACLTWCHVQLTWVWDWACKKCEDHKNKPNSVFFRINSTPTHTHAPTHTHVHTHTHTLRRRTKHLQFLRAVPASSFIVSCCRGRLVRKSKPRGNYFGSHCTCDCPTHLGEKFGKQPIKCSKYNFPGLSWPKIVSAGVCCVHSVFLGVHQHRTPDLLTWPNHLVHSRSGRRG